MKDDVIRIAHISDLHFGAKGYKEVIGSLAQHLRLRVRPHLLLVTGDLVDTPRKALITEVYEWLETLNQGLGWEPGQLPRYLVCPGNHDRHKRGNALPWRRPKYRFEKRFKANKSDDPFSHWLGEEPHRWRVRVVSVDSSVRARYSAQAFLGESDLKPVRELKEWNDDEEPPYLVIMLIHHHLLPLPASEREVQSAWDLFKLTSAVNPGRILESLSASYVDVVLHGHEHKRNIARYGSYRKDSNQIVIAAAASATGAETLKGCDSARASFNVLELRPDRSVWVTEVHGPSGNHNDWHDASTIQILDSTTLRHNRFLRSLYRWRKVRQAGPEPLAGAGHQSEWRKHVIFTAGRDAIVREHRTDWQITDGEFSFRIQNDTGQPARPAAEFKLTSASGNPNTPRISPKSGERGAFFFRVDMGTKAPVSAALIKTSYQWVDGILLTEDDFELIDMNNSGPFRGLRQEFVAASVLRPLRELCLSVTFPVGFYPDEEQVEVHCQRLPSGAIVRDEALEARRQFTGQTVILTVPYPLMDYRYVIAWRPVAGRLSTAAMTDFRDRCMETDLGDRLAKSFIDGVGNSSWARNCTVAVYTQQPDSRGRFLRRVGFGEGRMVGKKIPGTPPVEIDLRQQRGLYLHSGWGDTAIAVGTPSEFNEEARAQGLLAGEFVAAAMPFHGAPDEPPWGILRLGIYEAVPEVDRGGNRQAFRQILRRGYVQVLHTLVGA